MTPISLTKITITWSGFSGKVSTMRQSMASRTPLRLIMRIQITKEVVRKEEEVKKVKKIRKMEDIYKGQILRLIL